MRVIGIIGLPASGKGEFSRIAAEEGVPVVIMGDVIRNAVKDAGLLPTDENMGMTAQKLRETEGMDAIAMRCVPLVRATRAPLVLIDGIRGDAEVRVFRREFPGFRLIGITSDFTVRLSRVTSRGRSDDLKSEEELRIRDARENGWGLARALAEADITLTNNDTLSAFTDSVHRLLRGLGGGK